jgi:sulfide:quinone oxidoreductase
LKGYNPDPLFRFVHLVPARRQQMKRVLILGGGFGGVATAHRLKQKLAEEDEIILIDRRPNFMVGFRKTWAMTGMSSLEEGQRPLADLSRIGIQVIQDTVTLIDPAAKAVEVGGKRMEADALVVALGAQLVPDAVPGLAMHALNVYDPQEIPGVAQALSEFEGGKMVIGVFGMPYKCPPAPYEMALLASEFFKSRKLQVDIEVFTPQPMTLPILGQASCDDFEGRLAEHGVLFLPNHKATAVEPGEVVFATGRRSYDLLLAVPPHQPPAIVRESRLVGSSGWVGVKPHTLETEFPGVYAIGDVVHIAMANGKPLPKAGVFAEAMGEVVADRLAAEFAGQEPEAEFKGEGGCYLEVGGGEAMKLQGSFLVEPAPEAVLLEASPRHLQEKHAFETQRLDTWFA